MTQNTQTSPLPQPKPEQVTPPKPEDLTQAANPNRKIPRVDLPTQKIFRYLPKAIGSLLGLQGLYGTYQSIVFIFVEYPQLSAMLSSHEITQQDINQFASKAVVEIVVTAISLFFALRLTFTGSKEQEKLNLIVSSILVVINALIDNLLKQFTFGLILSQALSSSLIFLFQFFKNLLPF